MVAVERLIFFMYAILTIQVIKLGFHSSSQEGESVTKRRTAATSALSARHLSRSEPPRKLAVLGAGLQALSHIQVSVTPVKMELIDLR